MVNGELLVIRDWGFVIRDSEQRFFVAPFLRNVARPPTPPAECGRGFCGWGLAQRLVYSLNKFMIILSSCT